MVQVQLCAGQDAYREQQADAGEEPDQPGKYSGPGPGRGICSHT